MGTDAGDDLQLRKGVDDGSTDHSRTGVNSQGHDLKFSGSTEQSLRAQAFNGCACKGAACHVRAGAPCRARDMSDDGASRQCPTGICRPAVGLGSCTYLLLMWIHATGGFTGGCAA